MIRSSGQPPEQNRPTKKIRTAAAVRAGGGQLSVAIPSTPAGRAAGGMTTGN